MSSKRAAKAPPKKKLASPTKKAVSRRVKKSATSSSPATKKAAAKKIAVKKAVVKKTVSKKSSLPKTGTLVAAMPEEKVSFALAKKRGKPYHAPLFDSSIDEGIDPGALPLDEVHDEAEIAQHLQLQELAAISRKAREMNRPESHPDFDGETCVECGEDIPPERLRLHRVRCVDCQSFLEEEDARRRRLQG